MKRNNTMELVNWWKYCNVFILYLNLVKGLEFLIEPQHAVALLSQPLWWHCQASATTDVVYKWRFGEADAPVSDNQIVYPNGTLYIKEVKESSEGQYVCLATAGSETISTQPVSLNLAEISSSFSKSPQSKIVDVQASVTFECSIDSHPAAKITWLLNGGRVTKGTITMVSRTLSTLLIRSVSYRDEGKYNCLATNTMLDQNVSSLEGTLTVQGRPEILSSPQSISVPLGTSVMFDCVAAGRPSATVTWFFIAGNNPEVEIKTQAEYSVLTNNSLSINSVTDNLGGSYRCRAKNSAGEESKSALLTVTGPPAAPKFTATSEDQEDAEGDDVEFQCLATGNPPPIITWTKASGTLPVDRVTYPEPGKMLLKDIVGEDRGVYTCQATNTEGTISKSSTLTIQVSPSFSVTPISITVFQGVKATLQCEAVGNPTPSISWITPSNVILKPGEENSDIQISNDGTLTIKSPEFQPHNGIYTCRASNSIGMKSVRAQINVRGRPIFTKPPVSQLALEGDDVIIPCRAVGYPTPTIQWYRFGREGNIVSNDKYEVTAQGDLTIKSVVKEDKGNYICVAKTEYNYDRTGEATLNIIVPPKFVVRPERQKTEYGQTVVLNCITEGDPAPLQTWQKNDRKLILDSNMTLMTNNTLIIENIEEKHLGNYECVASNQGGKISATALVYTVDAPVFIESPTNATIVLGKNLTVICRASSENPPTMSWYKSNANGEKISVIKKVDSERISSTTIGDLNIKTIEVDDEGWYVCVAIDKEGESVSSPIFVDVQVEPVITSTNSPQKSETGGTATLTCEADGDPVPQIKWRSPQNVEVPDNTQDYNQSDNNLIINSVVSQKDGGNWICLACNILTCAEKVVELLIEGPPVITGAETSRDDTAVTIRCKASGLPAPSMTYFIDFDTEIVDQSGHSVEGNTLSINPANLRNAYSCKAENKYDHDTRIMTKPSKPTAPDIIRSEARQITLKWTDGLPSGLPVTKYNLQQKLNTEVEWQNSNLTVLDKQNEYLALNLEPYSSYVFRVSITNVLDTGPYSEESVRVETPADAPSMPKNVAVKDSVGTISVTFEEPEKFNGNKNDVRYEIGLRYRKPGTVEYVAMETVYKTSNQNLYVEFKNVTNGDYLITVKSVNTDVNKESKSVEIRLTVGKKVPEFIPIISSAVAINSERVELTWNTPECNKSCIPPITGFVITLVPESGANRTNQTDYQPDIDFQVYTLKYLEEYTTYTVYITAVNDIGPGTPSEPKIVTTLYAPFSSAAYTETLQASGWLIALLAGIIAVLLLIVIVAIIYIHHRRFKQQSAYAPRQSRFYLGQTNYLPQDSASDKGSRLWRRIFCLPIKGEYDLEPIQFEGYRSTVSDTHQANPSTISSLSHSPLVNNEFGLSKDNPLFQEDTLRPYTEHSPESSIPPPKPKRTKKPTSQQPILSPLNKPEIRITSPGGDRRSSSSTRQLIPDSPIDKNSVISYSYPDYTDSFSFQNGGYHWTSSHPGYSHQNFRDNKSLDDVTLSELEVLSQLFSDIEAEEESSAYSYRTRDEQNVFLY